MNNRTEEKVTLVRLTGCSKKIRLVGCFALLVFTSTLSSAYSAPERNVGVAKKPHRSERLSPQPLPPDAEIVDQTPITHIPYDQYNKRHTLEVQRYAEKTVVAAIRKTWERTTRKNSQSLFDETVHGDEVPPVANFSIDKSGRLLWIVLDTQPGAYGKALLQAIVQTAPFQPFSKGLPAQITLRIPFAGPKAEAVIEPELLENTRPSKPDWEPSVSAAGPK